jgi:hypothetical protein
MRSLVASVLVVLVAGACGGTDSKLIPLQDLPDDVAALVDQTWGDFERAFPARLDCMAPVSLLLVANVPDGDAVYRRDPARIEIEIPTSPARFPESLVHELAHHLEATCPEHTQIRTTFMHSQGLAGSAGWFGGDLWEKVPSEHFAEAVVQVVNGDRILHDDVIELTPDALEAVTHWGRGQS